MTEISYPRKTGAKVGLQRSRGLHSAKYECKECAHEMHLHEIHIIDQIVHYEYGPLTVPFNSIRPTSKSRSDHEDFCHRSILLHITRGIDRERLSLLTVSLFVALAFLQFQNSIEMKLCLIVTLSFLWTLLALLKKAEGNLK